MSLDVSKYKRVNKFPPLEPQTYPARLVQVVDLGTQKQYDWKTKEYTGDKPRVSLTFEFPTELIEVNEEMKPRWFSKEVTISMDDRSTLYKIMQALGAGKETDLVKLLGNPCTVTTGLTEGGKTKILSVNQLSKGMKVDELVNATNHFDLSAPDLEVFKKLPQWVQEKIQEAEEYEGGPLEALIETAKLEDDDIPF